jgi:hypothetical protein
MPVQVVEYFEKYALSGNGSGFGKCGSKFEQKNWVPFL